jgi:hypothetical protein
MGDHPDIRNLVHSVCCSRWTDTAAAAWSTQRSWDEPIPCVLQGVSSACHSLCCSLSGMQCNAVRCW